MKIKHLSFTLFFIFLATINTKVIDTNHLNGPNNTVYYGQNNVANGQNNQFAGSNNYVAGNTNDVIGNSNILNGYQNLVAGEGNQISGVGNLVSGQGNVVLGPGSSPQDIAAFQQQFLNMFSARGLPAPAGLLNSNSPISPVNQVQTVSSPSTSPIISSQSQPISQPSLNNFDSLAVQSSPAQVNVPISDNNANQSSSLNLDQTNVANDSLTQTQIQNQQISLASSQSSSQIRPQNQPDNSTHYQTSEQIQPQKLQVASNQASNQSQEIVSNKTNSTSQKNLRSQLRPSPYYNKNIDNSETSIDSSNQTSFESDNSKNTNNYQGSGIGQLSGSNNSLKTSSQVASYLTSNPNSNGVYVIPTQTGNETSNVTNVQYIGISNN